MMCWEEILKLIIKKKYIESVVRNETSVSDTAWKSEFTKQVNLLKCRNLSKISKFSFTSKSAF
jgi:hypothetical protein